MLRSCPALLQGFLASCRSHGDVGSCERHLDSCVAVLHHVALARQYDVELCRLVTTAWMRRETWMSLGIWWMLSCQMFYLFFLDAGGDEPSGFGDLFDVASSDRFGFLMLMQSKQSLAHWLVGAYLIFSLLTQLFCCCPILHACFPRSMLGQDLERNNFVTAMRLVALCGRAGVTSNLSLLLSTMPEPLFQQESVPQETFCCRLSQ